ncbi:BON domain-containing protein [Streptomyces sp. 5-8]|uniref:BON domain-containing protein n=1 Tax=Streptomyces musisoli TaxID=2802280 RepID=A0ABS1NVL6_9ACTN|nr:MULTISPECIES: BON domain-containing protein [Streptomyces]MBL1104150.1 BON domain-containing protein [Streptomyces musisoli]MBY8840223.1 BON domain-containing protein [Streptomyces sp. SP2-10]
MTDTSPPPPPTAGNLDYLVAHLADHLASGDLGELGVRLELRGDAVLLTGTVPSTRCRDDILRMAREELAGHPVHSDLLIAGTSSPDHGEDLT